MCFLSFTWKCCWRGLWKNVWKLAGFPVKQFEKSTSFYNSYRSGFFTLPNVFRVVSPITKFLSWPKFRPLVSHIRIQNFGLCSLRDLEVCVKKLDFKFTKDRSIESGATHDFYHFCGTVIGRMSSSSYSSPKQKKNLGIPNFETEKIGCYQSSNFSEISDRIEKNCVSCSSQLLKKWKHVLNIFTYPIVSEVRWRQGNTQTPDCEVVAMTPVERSKYRPTILEAFQLFEFSQVKKTIHVWKKLVTLKLEARVSGQLEEICSPVEKKSYCSLPSTEGALVFNGFGQRRKMQKRKAWISNWLCNGMFQTLF